MSNFRSRKLLNLAHRLNDCQFGLPGCPGYQAHGCEPIHADGLIYGKGTGIKAEDCYHVAGCHYCHEAYANLPKHEKPLVFDTACMRTLALYIKNGWLGVVA